MIQLTNELWFPDPSTANSEGIVAIGGDLTPERLLLAYQSGIFPWFEDGQPILWWSPNPRMVLFPSDFKVSKSLRKIIKANKFSITYNTYFSKVISNCANIYREGQGGTWITQKMQDAYIELYDMGLAVSVEVWEGETLVGGLYGIDLKNKKIFCGESMFSNVSDASKVGFYHLSRWLLNQNYKLIDCQMYTQHLESLGAVEIERKEFLDFLK